MRKLSTCICLVALMLVASVSFAEMEHKRLGPYTSTGVQSWVDLPTNGPVFFQILGTHTSLNLDFETSVYPGGYEVSADSLYPAEWIEIETDVTANGSGAINYVGYGFRIDVDTFVGTDVYIDLWYERVR